MRIVDLAGQRFGRLTAIERVDAVKGYGMWRCQCDCGNISTVRTSSLTSGQTKSCGCLRLDNMRKLSRPGARSLMPGARVGTLVVGELLSGYNGSHATYYRCQCDCGKTVLVRADRLKAGTTSSCGCKPRNIKWSVMDSKWDAYVKYRGHTLHVGSFNCINDALAAQTGARKRISADNSYFNYRFDRDSKIF